MSASNDVSVPAASPEPGALASDRTAAGGESKRPIETTTEFSGASSAKRFKSNNENPNDVLGGSSAGAGDRAGGSADHGTVVDHFTREERLQFESDLTQSNLVCGYRTSVIKKAMSVILDLEQLYHRIIGLEKIEDCFENVELPGTFTELTQDVDRLWKHLDFASTHSLNKLRHTDAHRALWEKLECENSDITHQGQRDRKISECVSAHYDAKCLRFLWDLMEQSHVDPSGDSILVVDVNGELIEDPNFRTKFEHLLLKISYSMGEFFDLPTSTNDMFRVLNGCLQCLKKQAINRFMVHGLRFN